MKTYITIKTVAYLAILFVITVTGCKRYADPAPVFEEYGGDKNLAERKVLIISIDGLSGSELKTIAPASIKKLQATSKYTYSVSNPQKTNDVSSWVSMMTGVSIAKHGIFDDSFIRGQGDDDHAVIKYYTSTYDYVMQYKPTYKTAVITPWPELRKYMLLANYTPAAITDVAVKDSTVNLLKQKNIGAMVVNFRDVEAAGNQAEFSAANEVYKSAVIKADEYVGNILDALKSRKEYAAENWLVIVTTNHGGSAADPKPGFMLCANSMFLEYDAGPKSDDNTVFVKFNQVAGSQYAFSASNRYKINQYQKFSFEMRVLVDGSLASDPPLVSNKSWASGASAGWGLFVSGQKWRFNVGDGTAARRKDILPLANTPVLTDGKWHHLAVTVNKSGMARIFQDGVFQAETNVSAITTWDAPLPSTLSILEDGTKNIRNVYGYKAKVSVADIRFWSDELNAETVTKYAKCDAVINSGHPNYSSLIGWWKGDENGGDILKDSSPMATNLDIMGAPEWQETPRNLCGLEVTAPKTVDVSTLMLYWLNIPILPAWTLDGKTWLKPFEIEFVK
jgi:hypothetical protein